MWNLTPLDVRQKKGDFRRAVWGYRTEPVDHFLDAVAKRLEELVKENVALTERTDDLQDQLALFRKREKAINEALEEREGFGGVDNVYFRSFIVQ